jgi:hypothetical protein
MDAFLEGPGRRSPQAGFGRAELGEKIAGPVRRRSADAGLARQVGDGQRPVGAFRAAVEQPLHGSP